MAAVMDGEAGGGGSLRVLEIALLASVVLHAGALLALADLRRDPEPRPPAPALNARLVIPEAPPAVSPPAPAPAHPKRAEPAPSPEPAAQPRAQPAPPRAAKPRSRPMPRQPETRNLAPTPARRIEKPPPAAASPNVAPVVAAVPVPAAETASPLPASLRPTVAAAAQAHARERDALAEYRRALRQAAARFVTHPEISGLRGVREARARVRVELGADGAVRALKIARSAGHATLDRNALSTLRKASAEAEVPAALRGRAFAVEIPFRFDLRGEED